MHAMIVVAVYYACKRSTMYMCVHVCVQVCVCVCVHPQCSCVYMCVCMVVSVCVCACPFCTNQLQSLYSSPKSDYSCSQLITDSCCLAANTKEEGAEKVRQLSPGHVCIYDYIKWRQLTTHHTTTSKQYVRNTCFPCSGLEVFEFGTWVKHTHTHIMTDTQPNTITWIAIVYTYTNTHIHTCMCIHPCMHESVHACTLALNITTIIRIHITSSASQSLCLLCIFASLCKLLCAWKKQHTSW